MRFVKLGVSTVVSVEHLVRVELVGDAIEAHLETGAVAVGRYSDAETAARAFDLLSRLLVGDPPKPARAQAPAVETK